MKGSKYGQLPVNRMITLELGSNDFLINEFTISRVDQAPQVSFQTYLTTQYHAEATKWYF